jgi:hypothetical protein
LKFEKTFEEWRYQSQISQDLLARVTAIDELVKIAKNEQTPTATQQQIADTLRDIASARPIGGFAYMLYATSAPSNPRRARQQLHSCSNSSETKTLDAYLGVVHVGQLQRP